MNFINMTPMLSKDNTLNNLPIGILVIEKNIYDQIDYRITHMNNLAKCLLFLSNINFFDSQKDKKILNRLKLFEEYSQTQEKANKTLYDYITSSNKKCEIAKTFVFSKNSFALLYIKIRHMDKMIYMTVDKFNDEMKINKKSFVQNIGYKYLITLYHEINNPLNSLMGPIEEIINNYYYNKENLDEESEEEEKINEDENSIISNNSNSSDSFSSDNEQNNSNNCKICTYHENKSENDSSEYSDKNIKNVDYSKLNKLQVESIQTSVTLLQMFLKNFIFYFQLKNSEEKDEKELNENISSLNLENFFSSISAKFKKLYEYKKIKYSEELKSLVNKNIKINYFYFKNFIKYIYIYFYQVYNKEDSINVKSVVLSENKIKLIFHSNCAVNENNSESGYHPSDSEEKVKNNNKIQTTQMTEDIIKTIINLLNIQCDISYNDYYNINKISITIPYTEDNSFASDNELNEFSNENFCIKLNDKKIKENKYFIRTLAMVNENNDQIANFLNHNCSSAMIHNDYLFRKLTNNRTCLQGSNKTLNWRCMNFKNRIKINDTSVLNKNNITENNINCYNTLNTCRKNSITFSLIKKNSSKSKRKKSMCYSKNNIIKSELINYNAEIAHDRNIYEHLLKNKCISLTDKDLFISKKNKYAFTKRFLHDDNLQYKNYTPGTNITVRNKKIDSITFYNMNMNDFDTYIKNSNLSNSLLKAINKNEYVYVDKSNKKNRKKIIDKYYVDLIDPNKIKNNIYKESSKIGPYGTTNQISNENSALCINQINYNFILNSNKDSFNNINPVKNNDLNMNINKNNNYIDEININNNQPSNQDVTFNQLIPCETHSKIISFSTVDKNEDSNKKNNLKCENSTDTNICLQEKKPTDILLQKMINIRSKRLDSHTKIFPKSTNTASSFQCLKDNTVFKNEHEQTKTCNCSDVLIVDDEELNIITLSNMLKKFKINADTCYNGKECLEKINEKNEKNCICGSKGYKLILMDVLMPCLNGKDTAERIQSMVNEGIIDNKLTVVFISASLDEKNYFDDFKSKNPIAKEFFLKPIKKSCISDVLRKYYYC